MFLFGLVYPAVGFLVGISFSTSRVGGSSLGKLFSLPSRYFWLKHSMWEVGFFKRKQRVLSLGSFYQMVHLLGLMVVGA